MKFNQWWEKQASPEFKQDIEAYHDLTKDKVEEFAKNAGIEESMDGVDVWIFSQPIVGKKKTAEFFFNWRKGSNPVIFTKSLGQVKMDSLKSLGAVK